MSTTAPMTLPSNVAKRDDINYEEVEHLVRDDDPDTSLCGIDQTEVSWDQGFMPCMACLEVARGGMN